MSRARPPTVLFAPATWGLAETRRLLAIARVGRVALDVHFADYGGRWSELVDRAAWPHTVLEPRITAGRERRLLNVDQRRADGVLFTTAEIRARVLSEFALFERLRPEVVVSGFCLSTAISARVAGIPLVAVRPLSGTRYLYRWIARGGPTSRDREGSTPWGPTVDRAHRSSTIDRGPDHLPPSPDVPASTCDRSSRGDAGHPWIQPSWLTRWFERLRSLGTLLDRSFVGPFNQIAVEYGLPPFRTMWDLFEGDITLICDPPEVAPGLELPADAVFVGPIDVYPVPVPARERPAEAPQPSRAARDSSAGAPQRAVLLDPQLLASVGGREKRRVDRVSAAFHARGWDVVLLPSGDNVLRRIDPQAVAPVEVAALSGGHKALLLAGRLGVPLVGVALHNEHRANLDVLQRRGVAERLPTRRVTPDRLLEAIERVAASAKSRRAARRWRSVLAHHDGAAGAVRHIERVVCGIDRPSGHAVRD